MKGRGKDVYGCGILRGGEGQLREFSGAGTGQGTERADWDEGTASACYKVVEQGKSPSCTRCRIGTRYNCRNAAIYNH